MPAKTPNSMEMYHLMLFGEKVLGDIWVTGERFRPKKSWKKTLSSFSEDGGSPLPAHACMCFPTFLFPAANSGASSVQLKIFKGSDKRLRPEAGPNHPCNETLPTLSTLCLGKETAAKGHSMTQSFKGLRDICEISRNLGLV